MNKLAYTSLKLKIKEDVVECPLQEDKILEIKKYVPIEDKIDLVEMVLIKSKENGIYNPLKVEIYLQLGLVYIYSNITFTDKQREDESKLYDILMSNEIIDKVIANIPEKDYIDLIEKIDERINAEMTYKVSAAAILNSFITDLPKQLDAMKDVVNNFDGSKYKAVVDFAKAANGGREI